VKEAVKSGLKGESGVIGHDIGRAGKLRAIEFPRIKGGKAFDPKTAWFGKMLKELGQPVGKAAAVSHGGDE
jgi:diphosphate-dependent phosphofructokinase